MWRSRLNDYSSPPAKRVHIQLTETDLYMLLYSCMVKKLPKTLLWTLNTSALNVENLREMSMSKNGCKKKKSCSGSYLQEKWPLDYEVNFNKNHFVFSSGHSTYQKVISWYADDAHISTVIKYCISLSVCLSITPFLSMSLIVSFSILWMPSTTWFCNHQVYLPIFIMFIWVFIRSKSIRSYLVIWTKGFSAILGT